AALVLDGAVDGLRADAAGLDLVHHDRAVQRLHLHLAGDPTQAHAAVGGRGMHPAIDVLDGNQSLHRLRVHAAAHVAHGEAAIHRLYRVVAIEALDVDACIHSLRIDAEALRQRHLEARLAGAVTACHLDLHHAAGAADLDARAAGV